MENSEDRSPPESDIQNTSTVSSQKQHEKLERKSSKMRLSKQAEVEFVEDSDHSLQQKQSGAKEIKCPDFDENSPNSDESERTVVCAEKDARLNDAVDCSPKDSSPEDAVASVALQADMEEKASKLNTQIVNVKVRLVRSQAVCDDVSCSPPPPDIHIYQDPSDPPPAVSTLSPNVATRNTNRRRLGHDSSQGSSMSDSGTSPALSRDSSFDAAYTDSTGTNLEEFIIRTLNKNRNDCAMLLRLENDMINFVKDSKEDRRRFPQMSSYHRMLVHRVAAFFGLEHNVDDSGKCVVINRGPSARVPDFKFRDHIWEEMALEDQPKKLILKRHRDCTSLEESLGTDRISVDDRKSKSFEEREEEYIEARNRIFHQRPQPNNLLVSQEGSTQTPRRQRNESGGPTTSDETNWLGSDGRPWSSTDSSGYSTDSSSRLRVNVTKASSFHGVTVLTRGDSSSSGASRFSKTDSLGSAVSGLNSPVVKPPTMPCSPPPSMEQLMPGVADVISEQGSFNQSSGSPFLSFTGDHGEPLAIWVASAIEQIPPGSFIINPQTGKAYTNPDGSLYRWYPPVPANLSAVVDDGRLANCSQQLPIVLPVNSTPEMLAAGSLSALSIRSDEGQFTGPPVHIVCLPDNRQFCHLSPQPAGPLPPAPGVAAAAIPASPAAAMAAAVTLLPAGGANGGGAVHLMTLPQMTVQSIETYPVQMPHQFPPPVDLAVQQAPAASGYCVEVDGLAQFKPSADVNYKRNASAVFYAPVGMPLQSVRYQMPSQVGCQLNLPYQSAAAAPASAPISVTSSLQLVYYSSVPGVGSQSYSASAVTTTQSVVQPVTSSCPAGSKTINVRNCDATAQQQQQQQQCVQGNVAYRPVLYSSSGNRCTADGRPTTLGVQQNHQIAFHQDMLPKVRLPTVSETNQPSAGPATIVSPSAAQRNPVTWPAQPLGTPVTIEGMSNGGQHVLYVCGLPPRLHYSQLSGYFAELVMNYGARRIDIIPAADNGNGCNGSGINDPSTVNLTASTVIAIFDNEIAAQKALASNAAFGGKYHLQMCSSSPYSNAADLHGHS